MSYQCSVVAVVVLIVVAVLILVNNVYLSLLDVCAGYSIVGVVKIRVMTNKL